MGQGAGRKKEKTDIFQGHVAIAANCRYYLLISSGQQAAQHEPLSSFGFDTTTGEGITLGDEERLPGLYVLGKPGTGKTNLLLNLALHDTKRGHGLFFLDPHGDAINAILAYGELERLTDKVLNGGSKEDEKWKRIHFPHFIDSSEVWLLDPEAEKSAFGINLTYCQNPESLTQRVNTYTKAYNVFRKAFSEDWGPWLQLIIQNTLYVFIENQGYTLAEAPRFLLDGEFRQKLVSNMRYNPEVVDFWRYRFSQRREREQEAQVDAALTRFSTFLGHPYVRDIIGQRKPTIDFARIMEQRKIVLLKFSLNLASDIKRFIGTIFISELLHAVRSRREGHRAHFSVFVDEFQNFATEDFADLITEGRKFGIATTIAHQERYGQLWENPKVLGATLACANKVLFQLTVRDAQELAPEFARFVEETKTGQEPVLAPSPHAVQDIWEKGHPDKHVMAVRDFYFWIADLLRQRPENGYYVFDPARCGVDDSNTYGSWPLDYLRATPQMLQLGIEAINRYYFAVMQGGQGKGSDILQAIENLSGLFGFIWRFEPHYYDRDSPYYKPYGDNKYYIKRTPNERNINFYRYLIDRVFDAPLREVIEEHKERVSEEKKSRNIDEQNLAQWQIKELILFIKRVFEIVPYYLQKHPVLIPSGQYTDQIRVEQTQQDLINEMAKELTDLPPYTAYAKLIAGDKTRISKIRTVEFEKGKYPAFCVLSEREAYYKGRDAVNREIVQRLEESGKKPTQDGPPPTSG